MRISTLMFIFLLNCLIFQLFQAPNAHAQLFPFGGGSTTETTEEISAEAIPTDQLDQLIDTLETEESRAEFLNNLRALSEVAKEQEDTQELFSFFEFLGLDEIFEKLRQDYEEFLTRYEINRSVFTNAVVSTLVILLAGIMMFVNYKLSKIIHRKIVAFKNRYGLSHKRVGVYVQILRIFGHLAIMLVAALIVAINWGMDPQNSVLLSFISFQALFSLIFVVLVGIAFWELIDGLIEYMHLNTAPHKAARMNTLIPIIRNVALIAFMTMFLLILLSELGINVMPLLAGAGILGIAIGFGAQTLVKDYITGFFIIFEDLIQVGDVVNVSGMGGLVERITMRKIQLRDLSGNVYTIPFGEISTVTNMTKEFSYYVFDIGVAYREDIDEVIGYLKEIDEEMRAHDDYKDLILEPLDVLGLDRFADSAIIIKARYKTLPLKQWLVGRAFNRMIKYKFDKEGVEIPFPHQTVYFGESKQGDAPPVYIRNVNAPAQTKKTPPAKKATVKKN